MPTGLLALFMSYISVDVSSYIFNLMNISLDLLLYFFSSINDWSAKLSPTHFQWLRYLEKQTLIYFIVSILCLLVILSRPLMPGYIPAMLCVVMCCVVLCY